LNKQTDSAEENLLLFWQEGDPKGRTRSTKNLKPTNMSKVLIIKNSPTSGLGKRRK
jgi:hypothetical protein